LPALVGGSHPWAIKGLNMIVEISHRKNETVQEYSLCVCSSIHDTDLLYIGLSSQASECDLMDRQPVYPRLETAVLPPLPAVVPSHVEHTLF